MNINKLLTYLVFLFIGFLLGIIYENPCKDSYLDKEIITIVDTHYIEKPGKIEGKKPSYSILQKKDSLPTIVQEIIDDTLIKNKPIVRTFITHFKDSVLDAKVTSYVIGELLSSDLDYKYNQMIINKKDSVIRYTERNKILLGIETNIGSQIKHISPNIEFYHKSGWGIQYRFEFNSFFGNSHNIGVKKVITFRNTKKH